jgi:gamma-glutamylcyclotransferase (GGCT)/AIG2-like uncharacterized protein YtfP
MLSAYLGVRFMNSNTSVGHVFTYGSLMFDPVWRRVVQGQYRRRPAALAGFDRFAVRDETYPGVVRSASAAACVTGFVYLDVNAADIARLDDFEGCDYQRIDAPVKDCDDGSLYQASLYLYLPRQRLLAQPWDETLFERVTMAKFLNRFCPPGLP